MAIRALSAAALTPLYGLLLLSPHLPPVSRRLLTMNPSSSSSSGYHSRTAAFPSPQPRDWRGGGGGRRRGGGRGGERSERIDALGRLLTRVLRHMAAELALDMRTDGYVRVRDLLRLNLQTFAKAPLKSHTVDEIREAVRQDNKQRFGLLEENGELLIRANQGHTVNTVTSESLLKPILSADEVSACVHGTYRKNLDSILQSGLKRMARLHVHFSSGLPSDGEVISGMLCPWKLTVEYVLMKPVEKRRYEAECQRLDTFRCQKSFTRWNEALHFRQQSDPDRGF